MPRDKDETIILRVPKWMKEQLKNFSGGQPLSDYIRSVLNQHLTNKNKEKLNG